MGRGSTARGVVGAVLIALWIAVPQVSAAAEEIAGDWDLTMDFGGQPTLATLSMAKKPDGSLAGKWGSSDLSNVKFDGQKLTFARVIRFGDQEFTMNFSGTVKDGKLTGNLSGEQGDTAVTGARRRPKPPVVGQWDLKYSIGGQDVTCKLVVSQRPDGTAEAQWTSDLAKSEVSNVKIVDGKLSLSRKTTFNDNAMESTFEATAKDNALTGMIKGQAGEMAVTGRRIGAALIGKWEITRTTEQGTRTNLLVIDPDLSGRYESFGGEVPIKDLKIEGDQVTFKTEMRFQDQTFVTDYKAKLDGKTLKGQSTSERGTNELAGKKLDPTPAP
ncbi:MAG: hypothetical protein KBE04_04350 [Phycisphaerae bacterium]|nr:hypothetical protein [Phycisphaerae bacterium]